MRAMTLSAACASQENKGLGRFWTVGHFAIVKGERRGIRAKKMERAFRVVGSGFGVSLEAPIIILISKFDAEYGGHRSESVCLSAPAGAG
jgi:hypothetical protein